MFFYHSLHVIVFLVCCQVIYTIYTIAVVSWEYERLEILSWNSISHMSFTIMIIYVPSSYTLENMLRLMISNWQKRWVKSYENSQLQRTEMIHLWIVVSSNNAKHLYNDNNALCFILRVYQVWWATSEESLAPTSASPSWPSLSSLTWWLGWLWNGFIDCLVAAKHTLS